MTQKRRIDRVEPINDGRRSIEPIVRKRIKAERAAFTLLRHHVALGAVLDQKRIGQMKWAREKRCASTRSCVRINAHQPALASSVLQVLRQNDEVAILLEPEWIGESFTWR